MSDRPNLTANATRVRSLLDHVAAAGRARHIRVRSAAPVSSRPARAAAGRTPPRPQRLLTMRLRLMEAFDDGEQLRAAAITAESALVDYGIDPVQLGIVPGSAPTRG